MSAGTAITIGNFDGVHRGHLELVAAARRAVGPDGKVVVLSFDPHPLTILRPTLAPARLTAFQQRRDRLAEAGADETISLAPDQSFLDQSACDFISWLADFYHPSVIVEGTDFRFGRGREGSVQTLQQHESEFDYRTVVVDPVSAVLTDRTEVLASSSIARWLLGHGRVRDAQCVLGRPYELISTVQQGDRRGRTIGVPTANLAQTDCMLPADGIYAGQAARPDGQTFPAAISVGTKPTFGEHPRVCEAHLLDYDGPLDDYGWTIRLSFHHWLRDQLVYRDVQSLVAQLNRDIERTRRIMLADEQPSAAIAQHASS